MLIGILENGCMPDELQPDYVSYAELFKRMLGQTGAELEFRTYRILDGEFPDSPQDCDGWLITGSKHGVYEDLPWMRREQAFIRSVQQQAIPLIGICFGHQIVAAALGGRVEKSTKGWGVGPHQYTLNKVLPFMQGASGQLILNALHQDQVVELPPGAEVVASSEFCEYAGLLYGDTILTFQPHPEFSAEFGRELISLRKGTPIPVDKADPALELLDNGVVPEGNLVANWMAGFFTQQERRAG